MAPGVYLVRSPVFDESLARTALAVPGYGFDTSTLLSDVAAAPVDLRALLSELLASSPEQAAGFYGVAQALIRARQICFTDDIQARAVLAPVSDSLEVPGWHLENHGCFKLSRFACTRSLGGCFVLESPLSHGRLEILDPRLAETVACLASGVVQSRDVEERNLGFLNLLVAAGLAVACDERGVSREDTDSQLRHWEFHDLLFHARSRSGRHDYGFGATWRFAGELEAPPAVKPNPWIESAQPLPLPQPDDRGLVRKGLTEVMDARRSIRTPSPVSLSRQELGELLYRCARLGERDGHPSRPYAGGGAIYELELYILVDRCYGLAPGLYYYDGNTHSLCSVSAPNGDTEAMLMSAMAAMGGAARPQVLMTIASRFARVANKYESMAYAVQLKNCGVLISTLYQVATAMGLAPCAIGAGDSDRFARVTGLDYAEEGAIGEFVLSR